MNIDEWVKVWTLAISFIQVIIWPLLVLIIAFYLRVPIKRFIGEIIEVTLKAGPVETTAKSKQAIEVAASLGAATAQLQSESAGLEHMAPTEATKEIANLVDLTVTPQSVRNLAGVRVLWVDDQPLNNTYARHALEALGIRFTIAISTQDALEELNRSSFDAIISDMGRPPDMRAGYTLLDKMRTKGFDLPYIIYAKGANNPKHKDEARGRGVYASVAGPQNLYKAVVTLFNKP